MKALFTGLGSIGSRHLRNLGALFRENLWGLEVTALRSTDRQLPPELGALVKHQVRSLAPDDHFDVAFITGPTHLHAATIGLLRGKASCLFIEKPLFDSTAYDLEALGLGPDQKAYVAAPMRWCGVYTELKKQLENRPAYAARAICSSYLPAWRPETDYRKVYSAKKEMGGGVALDLIHEWDYLADLFGLPEAVCAMRGKFSNLEIDSDDLAVYIARYPGFLSELHLDYFGKTRRRALEVFTEEGCLVADFEKGSVTLPKGEVLDLKEDVNRRYEREMAYFIDYAQNGAGESLNSPAKALDVLKIALGEDTWRKES